jgi:hypothetical protein
LKNYGKKKLFYIILIKIKINIINKMPQLDNIELFEELLILSIYFFSNITLVSLLFISSDFMIYLNTFWIFFLSFLTIDYLLKFIYLFNSFQIIEKLIIKNVFYLSKMQAKKNLYFLGITNFFNFFFNKYENILILHNNTKNINTYSIIKIIR